MVCYSKLFLGVKSFKIDEEVKNTVLQCFQTMMANLNYTNTNLIIRKRKYLRKRNEWLRIEIIY